MFNFESRARCLAIVLLLGSCHGKRTASSTIEGEASTAVAAASAHASDSTPRPRPPFIRAYPPGKWRLVRDLRHVVVWGSHILIRHADSRPEVPFNVAFWTSVPESVTRGRDEALALAREIAAKAAKSPNEFATLARKYSEDLPTRDDGGFLGGFSASELSSWPQVLDAFAALDVGAVSEVVETRYGFHILQRSETPAEQELSGAHLVIGHERAQWLEVLGRAGVPLRTREQALALASKLYEEARQTPERFQDLIERYSEHRDAIVGGDFGRWSTREMNPFPGRMKRLMKLAVGEIAPPVETHLGFEIIRRTEPRPRPDYRARSIVLRFEPRAPRDDASSRDSVLAKAVATAQELARDPSRFDELAAESVVEDQWEEGRGVPALTLELQKLELGAIAATPVQAEFRFLLARREAPQPAAGLSHVAELPAPEQPDLHEYFGEEKLEAMQSALRVAAERIDGKLSEQQRARLLELNKLEGRFSSERTLDEQRTVFLALCDEVRILLGRALYSEYLSSLRATVASRLLSDDYRGLPEGGL